ncbi:MAG: hypothetical protein PV344_02730, partial [Anaplasma sp.]|nr:hypothetical protein [Anaplasma sp.]
MRVNEADEARDVNISRFLLSSLRYLKAVKRRRREAVSSPFSEKQDVNISVKRASFFFFNMAIRSRHCCMSDVLEFVASRCTLLPPYFAI